MMDVEQGTVTYGVGESSNITRASVRAIFSAMNRLNGKDTTGSITPGVQDI